MPTITYEGRKIEAQEGQSVLEALLASGVHLSHSCRAGACGACVVRAAEGEIPPGAQGGMREAWRAQRYVYACQCRPRGALVVEPIGEGERVAAEVVGREALSPSVARVTLRLASPFSAMAGQYATIYRGTTARSYSIAARPDDRSIELHVRRVEGGAMSPYLCDKASPGDALTIQGPFGHCVYMPGRPAQPLLLAGTGTGLSPLWGILNDALAAGHTGPIHVFHAAAEPSGLYLVEELRRIAQAHPNVSYVPSALRTAGPGMEEGPLDGLILRRFPKTTGMRVFLCGGPSIVQVLKKKLFLAGVALNDIAADAFLPTAS